MTSQISPAEATKAAEKILGFYPEIPASDPKGFAAGLVKTLLIFPREVISRAVDPVRGLPACVTYLNLAQIRKHLDAWADEHHASQMRLDRANRLRLPEPPRDPQMEKRISDGLVKLVAQLKRGNGPSTTGDDQPSS